MAPTCGSGKCAWRLRLSILPPDSAPRRRASRDAAVGVSPRDLEPRPNHSAQANGPTRAPNDVTAPGLPHFWVAVAPVAVGAARPHVFQICYKNAKYGIAVGPSISVFLHLRRDRVTFRCFSSSEPRTWSWGGRRRVFQHLQRHNGSGGKWSWPNRVPLLKL